MASIEVEPTALSPVFGSVMSVTLSVGTVVTAVVSAGTMVVAGGAPPGAKAQAVEVNTLLSNVTSPLRAIARP